MATKNSKSSLFSRENIYQFAGLLISIVSISLIYELPKLGIRAQAAKIQIANTLKAAQQSDTGFVPERTIFVIIKDYEQQVCFTLMVWAMMIVIYKLRQVWQEKSILNDNLLDIETGERIIPEEALAHLKEVETRFFNIPQYVDKLLPRVVLTALRRFHSSHSIQDVSQAVREISESEADRLDSELSLVRYVAWAIPSVGFVGTVRGIGEALTKADQAIRGNIQGVTDSLGLAFNSTLIALFLSIILMYFIHLLQSRQESLILETEEYCRNQLLAVMKIPYKEESEMSIT